MTFYDQVMRHWLVNIEIHSLRKYEHHFVLFLLNGLSDEIIDIGGVCKELLEEHGKTMREALIQMGEEQEESDKMSIDGGAGAQQ